MVERSRFWDGTVLGDATVAPYDAATEFAEVMMAVSDSYASSDKGGVLSLASLAVTNFAANTVRVAAGQAMVWGTWYENSANLDFTIPTPAVSTRVDRIVLRKSWAAQTVRLTRIAGTEGGGTPALVQIAGTTWDIPIAIVSIVITTGTMTITDLRAGGGLWYRVSTGIRTDSNAGVGVTPSVWPTDRRVIQVGLAGSIEGIAATPGTAINDNTYYDGANFRALFTQAATRLQLQSGAYFWYNAPSVAAGAVQTFVERLRLDVAGNLGLGVVPSAWRSDLSALQVRNASLFSDGPDLYLMHNSYYDAVGRKAIATAAAAQFSMGSGTFTFQNAPSVAAGAAQTFTTRMVVDTNGITVQNGRIYGEAFTTHFLIEQTNTGPFTLVVPAAGTFQWAWGGIGGSAKVALNNVPNFYPSVDNTGTVGTGGNRWQTIYAVAGAINTSDVTMKDEFVLIDPVMALEAVCATPIYEFTYNGHDRRSVSFIGQEAHPLLSTDGVTADPQRTASMGVAAIQALAAQVEFLVKRLDALEGKVN